MPVDPGLTFEETGIDYLCVDELHGYKNLVTVSEICLLYTSRCV